VTDEPDPLFELLLRARPGELGADVVAELLRRPEWYDRAACRDADTAVFFPDRGESSRAALDFCSGCPVAGPCGDHATAQPERHGIWAGTSERQRRVIRSSGRRPLPAADDAA
jgi:hypothetical protein